jgi:hypothetical protein
MVMFKRTLKNSISFTALFLLLAVTFGELPAYALVDITSVTEGPLVKNPVRPGFVRDGGQSVKIGNKILWGFGDTLFSPPSVSGKSGWSNTAGLAELSNPLSVNEPLDANGAPYQFIPFSSADQAYNDLKNSGSDRYAYWVQGFVARPEQNDALVYFLRLKVGDGFLNYDLLNTGVAVVGANSTTATVVQESLFERPGPIYDGGVFDHNGYVYMYDCNFTTTECSITRSTISGALNRSNYRFWDGSEWDSDINNRVSNMPGQDAGWSEALGKYVMFSNQFLTGKIFMRTAESPQGPWSDEQLIYTASAYVYAVEYHPELSKNNGKTLLLTYYQGNADHNKGLHSLEVAMNVPDLQEPVSPQSPEQEFPAAPKTGYLYPLVYIVSAAGVTGAGYTIHKIKGRHKNKISAR